LVSNPQESRGEIREEGEGVVVVANPVDSMSGSADSLLDNCARVPIDVFYAVAIATAQKTGMGKSKRASDLIRDGDNEGTTEGGKGVGEDIELDSTIMRRKMREKRVVMMEGGDLCRAISYTACDHLASKIGVNLVAVPPVYEGAVHVRAAAGVARVRPCVVFSNKGCAFREKG